MGKIAVVFLIVALVAICNGNRLTREAPAEQPNVPAEFKPLLDAATKFFSEENFAKFKDTSAKIQKESQDLGEKASDMVTDWLKKLGDILEEKQKPAA